MIQHASMFIIRGKFGHRDTEGKHHVTVGSQRLEQCVYKDCWLPPEARREAWNRFPSEPQKELTPLQPAFRLLASRAARE